MVPMDSPEGLTTAQRETLLGVARDAVSHGLVHHALLALSAADFEEALRAPRATFVTLESDGRLRGCIGTLEARLPLVEDIARHAYAAAFEDPRFPPLAPHEAASLDYHISILSPPVPMDIRDEADLVAQLQPEVDGLIIEQGGRRATFLPSVWSSLPAPQDFVAHLKAKAGIRNGDTAPLKAWRYHTEGFGSHREA
ncbi:MAG: AmmeMemoRadiSam system protein A [Gammaproteobacteria bacterium]|nr:AmmeMemoRadiSam system protein A [Gammaproteobacteria bacterium]